MVNFTSVVYNDVRSSLRVDDNRRIAWRSQLNSVRGQARIRNISTSGMMLELRSTSKPENGCVFSFDTDLGHENYIPQNGRLVWAQKKNFAQNKYLCGIQFLEPAQYVLPNLRQKVMKGITSESLQQRIVNVIAPFLYGSILALLAFVLWQSSGIYETLNKSNRKFIEQSSQQALVALSYAHRYYATELQLTNVTAELEALKTLHLQSEAELSRVSKELESTKALLVQTESLLSQARQNGLQIDETRFEKTKTELEQTIALLRDQNSQLNNELIGLKQKLQQEPSDAKSESEAREIFAHYKNKMKEAREKIKFFNQEAKEIKQLAQAEKDKVRSALGNKGFLVKDGRVVKVDEEKFRSASTASQLKQEVTKPDQVQVEVNFYE